MPLYEYRCSDCDQKFEALVGLNDPRDVSCQDCSSPNVRRLISTFAMSGGYDDQFVASQSAPSGGCCGGGCGCGH